VVICAHVGADCMADPTHPDTHADWNAALVENAALLSVNRDRSKAIFSDFFSAFLCIRGEIRISSS